MSTNSDQGAWPLNAAAKRRQAARGDFASRIAGIPCMIDVTHYREQKPMGRWADSDMDCDGFTEFEYQVLDRRGRPAPWLERKATKDDEARILAEYLDHLKEVTAP